MWYEQRGWEQGDDKSNLNKGTINLIWAAIWAARLWAARWRARTELGHEGEVEAELLAEPVHGAAAALRQHLYDAGGELRFNASHVLAEIHHVRPRSGVY